MPLQDELARVREYLTDKGKRPSNEANTCYWVISPLLRQCGYEFHEIDVQAHDSAGKFPDFAILPHTDHTWFLEAKSWQDNLADAHVIQAINYAHTKGCRWVVLSNGREWRLYDDHIVGVQPADRLVAVALLERASELESLLGALSKSSIQSGGLSAFALQCRITAILNVQLTAPSSDVIKSLTNTLRGKHGLSAVTVSDTVDYFQAHLSIPQSLAVNAPSQTAGTQPTDVESATKISVPQSGLSLPDLQAAGSTMQFRKPDLVSFPDHTCRTVTTWRGLTIEVVRWLFEKNKVPRLPFRGRKGGKHYLINTNEFHADGKKMHHTVLLVNGQSIYVDINRSAPDFVNCLRVLCEEVGVSASEFHITLRA